MTSDDRNSEHLSRAERLAYDALYESSNHFRDYVDQLRQYGYSKPDIWHSYSETMHGN